MKTRNIDFFFLMTLLWEIKKGLPKKKLIYMIYMMQFGT